MFDSRTRLIFGNIAASLVLKGWGGVVQLLLVPLTLMCLGNYQTGLWMTIATTLMWIENFDIGLGNGLRNRLAEAVAKGDRALARSYVSTTLGTLTIIMLAVAQMAWAVLSVVDVYGLLQIDAQQAPQFADTLLVAFAITCLSFVFRTTGNVYLALQLPAVSNGIMVLGQSLTLVFVWLLAYAPQHDLTLVMLAYTLSPLLVHIVAFGYTFWVRYPDLCPTPKAFSRRHMGGLLNLGIQFFLIQVAGIILFMSSNLIISHLFSPEQVTPYQIAYRLYSLALVGFSIVGTPYWSATTDAFHRQEYSWIRQAQRKVLAMLVAIGAGLVLLVGVSPWVFDLWIGPGIEIPMQLSVWMALYILIVVVSQAYSFFLNGLGLLRLQLGMTLMAAILYLPVSMWLGQQFGLSGICMALVAVNLPGAVANIWQFHHTMLRLK